MSVYLNSQFISWRQKWLFLSRGTILSELVMGLLFRQLLFGMIPSEMFELALPSGSEVTWLMWTSMVLGCSAGISGLCYPKQVFWDQRDSNWQQWLLEGYQGLAGNILSSARVRVCVNILISVCVCVCVCSLQIGKKGLAACMLSCVWLFATLQIVASQGPLSMEFPRQEHWKGLPFPIPGDLPDSGLGPVSLASPTWKSPKRVSLGIF